MSRATQPRALKATTVLAAVVMAIAVSAPPATAATPVNLGGATQVVGVDAAGNTRDTFNASQSRDGRYTVYARPGLDWAFVVNDAVTGSDFVVPWYPGYATGGQVEMSADGRFVFYSAYPEQGLPPGFRIFRVNVATGSNTMLRPGVSGFGFGSIPGQLTVSANGRYVSVVSQWTDPTDAAVMRSDVFVTDATAGTTTSLGVEIAQPMDYTPGEDRMVRYAAISGDGKKVAFATSASLVARDTNTHYDVYVHDMATGANALASRTVAGRTGNMDSTAPSISADGRYVTFRSRSTNLAPGVTDTSVTQAYLVDMSTFRTSMISKTAAGVAGNAAAHPTGISSTGRYVVFESAATDYGFPANPQGYTSWQVYRYDRVNDTIGLVSHAAGKKYPSNKGTEELGTLGRQNASISADGAHITYDSRGLDLDKTAGIVDEKGTWDAFAWSQ